MPAANLTSLANAVKTVVDSEVVRGIFTNEEFFNLFQSSESPGDSSKRWQLRTSGVAGGTTTEGAPFRATDRNAYSRPTLAYRLYDASVGITDHVKAALKRNEAAYWDAIGDEIDEAVQGVKDAVMTQWLGSTGEGILLAIDSTGTYAGLDHAAVTGWTSYEDTTAAALSYALLDDMRENLRDNERRSRPNLILAPENQITNYTRLSGPGVRNAVTAMVPNGEQPRTDLGEDVDNPVFGKMPIVGVADMNDQTWLMLPRETVRIIYHEREPGDLGWSTEPIARGGFESDMNVSWFGVIIVKDPGRCGKLSAITA